MLYPYHVNGKFCFTTDDDYKFMVVIKWDSEQSGPEVIKQFFQLLKEIKMLKN